MEKQAAKKTRAPKAMGVQLECLLAYMEEHTAFATGKLLGAQGKAAHEKHWNILTNKLNELNGPVKPVEGWKKLWCDQQNKARSRAAEGKAQRKATGNNIDQVIVLKDYDQRLLSVIGAESAVGLPIEEVGFEKQVMDIIEPSVLLQLNNTVKRRNVEDVLQLDDTVTEQDMSYTLHADVEDGSQQENMSLPSHSRNTEPSMYKRFKKAAMQEESANSCEILDLVDDTSKKYKYVTLHRLEDVSEEEENVSEIASNNTKPQQTPKCVGKRSRKMSVQDKTSNYFKIAQDKQNDTLQIISNNLERIASAVEKQNNLFEKYLQLQERTLDLLMLSRNS